MMLIDYDDVDGYDDADDDDKTELNMIVSADFGCVDN